MRAQHYDLPFDDVLKRIPELKVLLTHFKTHSNTRKGLSSQAGPGEYRRIEEMTLLTLERAKLPRKLLFR
jgi:hypothetical protein